MQNRDTLKVYLEPMVGPVVQNMPTVNLSAFGLDGMSMPEFFQTEETPRPGLELKKQVCKVMCWPAALWYYPARCACALLLLEMA